jgi:hypothetical protein
MADRVPAREGYDAIVDLGSSNLRGNYACAVVKLTFDIGEDGRLAPAPAEPLLHDFRDPALDPRLRAGTDFWPWKERTDVAFQGAAHAPDGVPVGEVAVAAMVGGATKRLDVFGRREIEWTPDGRPRIPAPEPFAEMPLTYDNAYGGIDWRVQVEGPLTVGVMADLVADHPGMYPRNPFGKGYLVAQGAVPEMEMPNLEDPDDRLTGERLIVGDPRRWYLQPLPWCLDFVHPVAFPRIVHFGLDADAWFPGPQDERMPEVRRGFLAPGYRAAMATWPLELGPHPDYRQEASLGMTFGALSAETPIAVEGMHPERPRVGFALPEPPRIEIEIEGDRQEVAPALHSVVVRPAEMRVNLVYGALTLLPRLFMPRIHKEIPIAARVRGDAPIHYEAPPTVREEIAAAQARAEAQSTEGKS